MSKKILSVVMALIMLLGAIPVSSMTAGAQETDLGNNILMVRMGGTDRFETANLIADEGWVESEYAVLVSADAYADALAGGALAYALDAPIFLVRGDSVKSTVMARLENLGVSHVYLLGGSAAISPKIESQLKKDGYIVDRLWGESRYQTAIEIAKEIENIYGCVPEEVIITSGVNYPDALSAAPVSALNMSPILYSPKDGKLDEGTRKFITDRSIDTAYVLGGVNAVADSVSSVLRGCDVTTITRIGGNNRYETSLLITKHFMDLFDYGAVAIATGKNFPDALAGGALAARYFMPVLLTDNSTVSSSTKDFVQEIETSMVYVFGDESVVSDEIVMEHVEEIGEKYDAFFTPEVKAELTEYFAPLVDIVDLANMRREGYCIEHYYDIEDDCCYLNVDVFLDENYVFGLSDSVLIYSNGDIVLPERSFPKNIDDPCEAAAWLEVWSFEMAKSTALTNGDVSYAELYEMYVDYYELLNESIDVEDVEGPDELCKKAMVIGVSQGPDEYRKTTVDEVMLYFLATNYLSHLQSAFSDGDFIPVGMKEYLEMLRVYVDYFGYRDTFICDERIPAASKMSRMLKNKIAAADDESVLTRQEMANIMVELYEKTYGEIEASLYEDESFIDTDDINCRKAAWMGYYFASYSDGYFLPNEEVSIEEASYNIDAFISSSRHGYLSSGGSYALDNSVSVLDAMDMLITSVTAYNCVWGWNETWC